ncbi:ubiquitin carboxyl-terminal hydrolase 40-like isoform X2 [Acropora palmata]|uniref:ubiquitin carboxyl-terminal hydrolase 40-like isoform X2 n=1 Tax=Acropora palmata TaxID=6131 RepID=UPI003D9FD439
MFGSLFEKENEGENPRDTETNLRSRLCKLQCPPEPRGKTRICGLQNQGATCYLNSLLQTLFFTPEFRNGIFQLGPGDLKYEQSSKVRVILVELQKLFAKLLLLDQESVNTTDLTDSFGWKGKQSFEQHDVQELNRILFNAVESSLVSTSCQGLIRKLYRGTLITKVICKECGFTSEREEDFLDLPLILSGCSSLEQSLSMSYIVKESLEGTNQYKCSSCRRNVDAAKGSKIRKLPPILTFSLLRFDYDFQRGERFKDTKRFSFPSELNMSEFCEASNELQNQQYELFSAVIHSGSCYGGHYHVYIRDLEGLGLWHEPDKEPVKIVHEDEKGRENFFNCDHPVDLLSTLLRKLGGTASVNQLCQHMSRQAGISWNKRYKSQYGPLTKFLKTNSDIFSFDESCGGVSLKCDGGKISEKLSSSGTRMRDESISITNDFTKSGVETSTTVQEEKQPLLERSAVVPEFGHCWFDVNDARISCIRERDIQNQFAGKESAYMLFYRKKSLVVSRNDPLSSVSAGLREEVEGMNCQLKKQREEYELRLNQILVNIHFGKHFTVADGILQMKEETCSEPRVVAIDRRKSAADLVETLRKLYALADKEASKLTVHIARYLPAGLHLFQEVTKHPEKSLVESGVCDGTDLFLWNGKEVNGYRVLAGNETAPVLLTLMYTLSQDEKAVEIQKRFRKDTTVGEIKLMLCNSFGIDCQNLLLSSVKIRGKTSDSVRLIADLDGQTLNETGIQDGDRLIAEKSGEIPPSTQSTAEVTSTKNEEQSNFMTFAVENRCLVTKAEKDGNSCNSWPLFTVKVIKEETIGQLKTKVLEMQSDNQESKDVQCRFRVDDDFEGLGPTVYDHWTISESWLKEGQKFVLEPGAPLLPSEIMIRFYVRSSNHSRVEMEQTVRKDITIGQCLELLISNAGLQGGKWHLRKTNWMSEPAESLDKEDSTLEKENIKNGDVVIVEEGRILPKGFICLSLWQTRGMKETKTGNSGYDLSHQVSTDLQVMENPRKEHDTAEIAQCFEAVGNIEISQDSLLFNLKLQISALPQFSDHMIPTPGFVRLREIENGQLTRVLRGTNRTLSQLKLTSSTHLFIRILKQEEDLSASAVPLKIRRRIHGKRLYSADEEEVIFEPSEGATPNSLRQFVSGVCDIPLDRLNIAKYLRQKYDWLVISDTFSRQGKKGGKKKVNLRQSPFHLQDGDIIGVKDCGHIEGDSNKDDFSTPDDDIAKKQLQQVEEERKQRKRERRTKRPEVPLVIHVDEFR